MDLQRISVDVQPGTERGTPHGHAQSPQYLYAADLEFTNHVTQRPIRIPSQERWFCYGRFIAYEDLQGVVGPYLALGRRGLSNGISRSFRLKEKTLRQGDSMRDVFLPGVG